MTSQWPRWRLKSPASRLFTQSFIPTQIKENIKAPGHWPLCGEFTGTGEFPAQKASNAENVSIWWRHHVRMRMYQCNETTAHHNRVHIINVTSGECCRVKNHWQINCLFNCVYSMPSKKRLTPALLVLCEGKPLGPVDSPHKGPATRGAFPSRDAIRYSWCVAIPNGITRLV